MDAGGIGRGCTPRDLLQQLGRFRVLNNREVHVLIAKNKDNRCTSAQEAHSLIMKELIERRDLLQNKYMNLLSFDVENQNGDLVLSPD